MQYLSSSIKMGVTKFLTIRQVQWIKWVVFGAYTSITVVLFTLKEVYWYKIFHFDPEKYQKIVIRNVKVNHGVVCSFQLLTLISFVFAVFGISKIFCTLLMIKKTNPTMKTNMKLLIIHTIAMTAQLISSMQPYFIFFIF